MKNGMRVKLYDETGRKMLEAIDDDADKLIKKTTEWLKKFR